MHPLMSDIQLVPLVCVFLIYRHLVILHIHIKICAEVSLYSYMTMWSIYEVFNRILRKIACIFTKPTLVWIRLLCRYNYKCVLRDDFTKAVGRSYLILMAIDWRKFCNIERNTKCINVSMYHYHHQQLYSWGGSI